MRWSFPTVVLAPRGAWAAAPSRARCQRLFAWAAAAGFEGVEISPRWLDVHALSDAQIDRLRADVEAAGLVVSGLNLNRFILTRSPQAADHLWRLARSIELAAALGAKLIALSQSLPTPPADGRPPLRGEEVPLAEHRRAVALLAPIASCTARANVKLSIELHDDGLVDTVAWCLWHLHALRKEIAAAKSETSRTDAMAGPAGMADVAGTAGTAAIGVNPDLGNICRGPGPMPDWEAALRTLAPHANCWHIKNYRDGRATPIWDGDIEYTRAFRIMRDARYDGWVSIESYGVSTDEDVLRLQQDSLNWARRASATCTPSSI